MIRTSLDTACSFLQNIAVPGDITKPLAHDTFKATLEAYSIGVQHSDIILPADTLKVATMPSSAHFTAHALLCGPGGRLQIQCQALSCLLDTHFVRLPDICGALIERAGMQNPARL